VARLDSFDVNAYPPTWFDLSADVNGWWDRDLVPGPGVPPAPPAPGPAPTPAPSPTQQGPGPGGGQPWPVFDPTFRKRKVKELEDDEDELERLFRVKEKRPIELWRDPTRPLDDEPETEDDPTVIVEIDKEVERIVFKETFQVVEVEKIVERIVEVEKVVTLERLSVASPVPTRWSPWWTAAAFVAAMAGAAAVTALIMRKPSKKKARKKRRPKWRAKLRP
jgi:hypothetical protein